MRSRNEDGLATADRLALSALEAALVGARETADERPALEVLAGALAELGVRATPSQRSATVLAQGMDAWLRRIRSAGRGETTIGAYRHSIEDLLSWAQREQRTGELFQERAIVDYLEDYRRRCAPAPATYHRRFVLLRRFMRWLSRSEGVPDPFLDLQAPPKPRQEGDWLTREEFARMLDAASQPERNRPGLVERDRLVLIALVMTGLRRSELLNLQWRDVDLDGSSPSLLVRRGKGGKPRRQPLAAELVAALRREHQQRSPAAEAPVFCGLQGRRLDPKILGQIIHRAAQRAGIDKHVTAHMLRHTAATWLRQQTGDARLVAEYLGHADLSTVTRYAHVAPAELHAAAQAIAAHAAEPART